jgi:hypothetical protein
MADRQITPNLDKTLASKAAVLMLAALCAAPTLAASGSRIPCSEAVEATLSVPVNALITESISHDLPPPAINDDTSIDEIEVVSSTNLLAPRAEAAIRDAFAESDNTGVRSSDTVLTRTLLLPPMAGTKSDTKTRDEKSEESDSGMNTKLPGISDEALSRYKKQMYRRDI